MWSSAVPLLLTPILILLQSPSVLQSQEQCAAAPSRGHLEEILGKPEESRSTKDPIRFRKDGRSIIVKFNSSDRAENLIINGDSGTIGLTELLKRLVPKRNRGRFLKRGPGTTFSISSENYAEEYECLTIEYSEQYGPMNSMPATVKVTWKANPNNGAGQPADSP